MPPRRSTSRSALPREDGAAPVGTGGAAAVLALCFVLGLLGPPRHSPELDRALGAPGVSAAGEQRASAHVDAAPHSLPLWGAPEGASWSPPRLPQSHAGRSVWLAPWYGERARQESYAALVAVRIRRLRAGAASHVGHASADQPPIVTRPLRGPPAA